MARAATKRGTRRKSKPKTPATSPSQQPQPAALTPAAITVPADPGSPDWSIESEEVDQLEPEPVEVSSQARNARSAHWMAWQDRRLVTEVNEVRPFLEHPGKDTSAAWEKVSQHLLETTTKEHNKDKSQLILDRSGSACRSRFKKLFQLHKVCIYMLSLVPLTYWHPEG